VENWAYDNRARQLAARLPRYRHRVVHWTKHNRSEIEHEARHAALIVCPFPPLLTKMPEAMRHRIVAGLTSARALELCL
jgi:hypothetical protein